MTTRLSGSRCETQEPWFLRPRRELDASRPCWNSHINLPWYFFYQQKHMYIYIYIHINIYIYIYGVQWWTGDIFWDQKLNCKKQQTSPTSLLSQLAAASGVHQVVVAHFSRSRHIVLCRWQCIMIGALWQSCLRRHKARHGWTIASSLHRWPMKPVPWLQGGSKVVLFEMPPWGCWDYSLLWWRVIDV